MEDPIDGDYGAIPASLPARFAIKIPKDIAPGSYSVSAMGGRAGGEMVVAVIEVDLERREMPRAITSRLPQLYFEKKGETREVELIGDFGNGDFVDVCHPVPARCPERVRNGENRRVHAVFSSVTVRLSTGFSTGGVENSDVQPGT
jgi:hypothetical protein